MRERGQNADHQEEPTSGRRSEWLAGALAVCLLAACLAVTLGSCGGDDLVVGGQLPNPTAGGPTPTEAP